MKGGKTNDNSTIHRRDRSNGRRTGSRSYHRRIIKTKEEKRMIGAAIIGGGLLLTAGLAYVFGYACVRG